MGFHRFNSETAPKWRSLTMNIPSWIAILASITLGACGGTGTIKPDPAALHGDFSGKDFSGAVAFVPVASNIPRVPASNGKKPRLSEVEIEQMLYIDAHCQTELFKQLPGWAQAIAKEGGWSALAIAVGEAGFAAEFPGAEVARYFLGGLGYGFFAGTNTGRYRQESSEKGSQGYCVVLQMWAVQNRYPGTLEGFLAVPWYGNGQTSLPKATDSPTAPTLPHVSNSRLPPPR